FTGIQSIQIFGGGGSDSVWVLGTEAGRMLTIEGGSGNVTVHIGGTPPPLVFNPPPFIYQPPSFTVALPPALVYDKTTITLHNLSFEMSIFDWIARGGFSDPQNAFQARHAAARAGPANSVCVHRPARARWIADRGPGDHQRRRGPVRPPERRDLREPERHVRVRPGGPEAGPTNAQDRRRQPG